MTTNLTKIFFGIIDKEKLIKSKNFNVGFWGSEEYFKKLGRPIDWEHGVLQLFQNNHDDLWWTISGRFSKIKMEDFHQIKNQLIQIHSNFETISDIMELISNGGSLFDVKDDFDFDNIIIEGEDDREFIDFEHYKRINLNEKNTIWVLEIIRYIDVNYEIDGDTLNLNYDSSEDLNLDERFVCSVLLKLCRNNLSKSGTYSI